MAYKNNIAVGQHEIHCLGSYRTLVKTNELVQQRCVDISKHVDERHQGYAVPRLSFADIQGMMDFRRTLFNDKGEIVDETRCWVQRFKQPTVDFQHADRLFVVLRSMSWSDDLGQSSVSMAFDEDEDEDLEEEECDDEAVEVFTRADVAEDCKNRCCLQQSSEMERLRARNADTDVRWMSWVEELLVCQ